METMVSTSLAPGGTIAFTDSISRTVSIKSPESAPLIKTVSALVQQ
jgi:hypothetical protein